MKKIISIVSLSLVSVLVISCAEDSDQRASTKKFTAIFDNSNFDATYEPIDIAQTPDGGYLVLSARPAATSDYSAIHLLKSDQYGNFEKELIVDDSLVNPLSSLSLVDNSFYFVCMNTNALARIVKIDER